MKLLVDKSCLGFLADVRPLGAHGGPREPWDGLRLEKHSKSHQKLVSETNYKARSGVLCVFGAGREKVNR